MAKRYLDASILDKLKHLREVDFYEGTPLAHVNPREKWEETEKEIGERYTDAELRALRRHGFSGKSFEDRGEAIGFKEMYSVCYRIASRSIHMFDPAETLFADFLSRKKVNIRNCFEPGGNNWKGTKICSLAVMSYGGNYLECTSRGKTNNTRFRLREIL